MGSSGGSSAQSAPAATVSPSVPAATAPTSVPGATPPTSVPAATPPTSVPVAVPQTADIEQIIQELFDMGEGIWDWDKDTVTCALRAAYNDPDQAWDYLYFGIPEEVAVPVPTFPSNQGSGGADPTTEKGLPGAASVGDGCLDFLGNNKQKLYCCHCTAPGCENEYVLRRHYWDFHGHLKVKCSICWNQFRRDEDLKSHESEEHAKTSEALVISCEHCSKVFKYFFGLRNHNTRKHSMYQAMCMICRNVFLDDIELEEHAKKHNKKSVKHCIYSEEEGCED